MPPRTPLPVWFLDGKPVQPVRASVDAAIILEDEEFQYAWRCCEVPCAALTIDSRRTYQQARRRDLSRYTVVERWMRGRPGHGTKWGRSPIILLIDPHSRALALLDGWHRVEIAVHELPLRTVPAIAALGRNA